MFFSFQRCRKYLWSTTTTSILLLKRLTAAANSSVSLTLRILRRCELLEVDVSCAEVMMPPAIRPLPHYPSSAISIFPTYPHIAPHLVHARVHQAENQHKLLAPRPIPPDPPDQI
jgi:hypothetical protein